MPDHLIPEDVKSFILENINSIPEMEGLLLFFKNPEDFFTSDVIALRLYIELKESEEILKALFDRGLVTRSLEKPFVYRYSPRTPDVRDIMPRIAEAYSRYLLPVTFLIHSKSKRRIQEFANAFWVRKD